VVIFHACVAHVHTNELGSTGFLANKSKKMTRTRVNPMDRMDQLIDHLANKFWQRRSDRLPHSQVDLDKTALNKPVFSTALAKGHFSSLIPSLPSSNVAVPHWQPPTAGSALPRPESRQQLSTSGRETPLVIEQHSGSRYFPQFRTQAAVTSEAPKVSTYTLIASGSNLPHPDKVAKGGEDAWFVKASEQGGGVMAVADGVGGYSDIGIDPGMYARVLSYEAAQAHAKSPDLKGVIAIAQNETKLPGAATLCVVEVEGSRLKGANVGDSGFRVIREGQLLLASAPLQHRFNCPYQLAYQELSSDDSTDSAEDADLYDIPVQPGDIVVAGTDGLFDNVFDSEIVKVTTDSVKNGGSALEATKAASEALVKLARKNAENTQYESPYAVEWEKAQQEMNTGAFSVQWPFKQNKKLGGKMDDITVVVGKVVATAEGSNDLKEAVAESEALARAMEAERGKAKDEEAKAQRTLKLRREMEAAVKEAEQKAIKEQEAAFAAKMAAKDATKKEEEDRPSWFTAEEIAEMDKATVWDLLQKRGLPTSGKLDKLKERLSNLKAPES
jgi:protein phosphatase PTC7